MNQLRYKIAEEKVVRPTPYLSSLVVNTPYEFDGFTSSPRIDRVLNTAIGVKSNSQVLSRIAFQIMISLSSAMIASTMILLALYLPLQAQNNLILKSAKSLTNKKLQLQATVQEASSYSLLFNSASTLSLMDSEEVIHLNSNSVKIEKQKNNLLTINKYPSLQFTGF